MCNDIFQAYIKELKKYILQCHISLLFFRLMIHLYMSETSYQGHWSIYDATIICLKVIRSLTQTFHFYEVTTDLNLFSGFPNLLKSMLENIKMTCLKCDKNMTWLSCIRKFQILSSRLNMKLVDSFTNADLMNKIFVYAIFLYWS